MAWDPQPFIEPLSAERPCGENLDDSDGLVALDAFELFGQPTLEPEPKDEGEPVAKEPRPSDRPPEWDAVRELALAALEKSKDFRPLAYLSAAFLRTDGLGAFCDTVVVAAKWIEIYWETAYPSAEDGAIFRRGALSCLADRAAIVEGVRRVPLVISREHGKISLRDCDIAAGQVPPGEKDIRSDEARINAAFATMPQEALEKLRDDVAGAAAALKAIDEAMREHAGVEAALDFDQIQAQLARVSRVLRAQLALRPGAEGAVDGEGGVATGGAAPVGVVRTREEAMRALDAVANFFRGAEPSSPIPMFVDRAKRLASKTFLEVLADVAPGGLSEARSAGGVKDE